MRIRTVNELWGKTIKRTRWRPSHAFSPSALEPEAIPCRVLNDGLMSTDSDSNSAYDKGRQYSNDVNVRGLSYETRVMSFGDGSNGALGRHTDGGYLSDAFCPKTVQELPGNISKIAAGHYHSLAVTEDGEVWAWGRNSEGQLGSRDGNSRQQWSQPQKVRGLENLKIKDIAGSGVVSMAIASDGSLWSWGSSKRGQLGLSPGAIHAEAPQPVEGLAGLEVSQVALGWGHALACTPDGEVYAWGYPSDGRLGFHPGHLQAPKEETSFQNSRATSGRSEAPSGSEAGAGETMMEPVWKPCRIDALRHVKVTNVACGLDHSLALAENGNLYSFGDNSLGQLGRHPSDGLMGMVKFLNAGSKVIHAAAGLGHSLAIAVNPSNPGRAFPSLDLDPLISWEKETQEAARGSLYSWGWNGSSQLGRGGDSDLPGLVEELNGEKLVRIAAGRVHSAGLTSKREVWTWGSGRSGRLGLDSPSDESYPFPIESVPVWRTLQIACGFDHSLLLVRDLVSSSRQKPS